MYSNIPEDHSLITISKRHLLKLIRYISLLAIAIVILSSGPAHAQKRGVMNLPNYNNAPYHFGFILALNQMHFTVKMKEGFQLVTYTDYQLPD